MAARPSGPSWAASGAEGIRGLQSMAPLHTLTTILAVTNVDIELSMDRLARDFHLILGHHCGLLDMATAMRASFRQRRLVGFRRSAREAGGCRCPFFP